jgi:hypothetical protein
MARRGVAMVAGMGLVGALLFGQPGRPTPVFAQDCIVGGQTVDLNALQVPGDDKVTICHATGSVTNPYVLSTVSLAACAAHLPGAPGHHQGEGPQDIFPDGGCVD